METTSTVHSQQIQLARGGSLTFARPLVMGILNCTPDSFHDGGSFLTATTARDRALEMQKQGADIVDIGGESTRPGSSAVSADEELARVIPVIAEIRKETDIPISIDTTKAIVADAAISAGADIVNDISAMRHDERMAPLVSNRQVPVVLMHMQGTPQTMQLAPSYEHVIEELFTFFQERIAFCQAQGIDPGRIILDPGIGFGKRLEDNLAILSNLDSFRPLGCPILIGLSRKSFIGKLDPNGSASSDRLGGSIAGAVAAVQRGAAIVRVHDVAETVQALRVFEAIATRSGK